MKVKDLAATLAHLKRVLAAPGLEPAQRERLRKGQRELERQQRAGKPNRARVYGATKLIMDTALEMLPNAKVTPDPEDQDPARRAR